MTKEERKKFLYETVEEIQGLAAGISNPPNDDEAELGTQEDVIAYRVACIAYRCAIVTTLATDMRPPFIVLGEWAGAAAAAEADELAMLSPAEMAQMVQILFAEIQPPAHGHQN